MTLDVLNKTYTNRRNDAKLQKVMTKQKIKSIIHK